MSLGPTLQIQIENTRLEVLAYIHLPVNNIWIFFNNWDKIIANFVLLQMPFISHLVSV